MPYDLEGLWDKSSVIAYTNGKDLKVSKSLYENAAFLIKWA